MHKATRHSAGASIELMDDGVLVVRMFGPLTGAALQHVKAEIATRYADAVIAAFMVDYRSAVVALTGSDLDEILAGERHGSTPSLPAAQLVAAVMAPVFLGHCLRMAQAGIVRQVFTDEAGALRWASRHALRVKTRS